MTTRSVVAGLCLTILSMLSAVATAADRDVSLCATPFFDSLWGRGRWSLDEPQQVRWLQSLLEHLDPDKIYFQQCDFVELQESWRQAGDSGNALPVLLLIRNRLQFRVSNAQRLVEHWLTAHHDFSQAENWPVEFRDFALHDVALAERWRQRIKEELQREQANQRDLAAASEFLRGRYQTIDVLVQNMTEDYLRYLDADVVHRAYNRFTTPKTISWLRIYDVPQPLPSVLEKQNAVGWELIAIRDAEQKTHYLDGFWHYGPSAAQQLPPEIYNSPVILELEHPHTRQRQSIAAPQSIKHLSFVPPTAVKLPTKATAAPKPTATTTAVQQPVLQPRRRRR
jgi:hypothetical protein